MAAREVNEAYGGFHDVETARNELGIGADVSDADVSRFVSEDLGQRARVAQDAMQTSTRAQEEAERKGREAAKHEQEAIRREQEAAKHEQEAMKREQEASQKVAQAEQRVKDAEQAKASQQSILESERTKRRLYENVLDPYGTVVLANTYGRVYDPLSSRLAEKERLKREVQNELAEERRWKEANKPIRIKTAAVAKPRTNTRPRTRSKSRPKTKAKSKTRAKSKTKAKTNSKR